MSPLHQHPHQGRYSFIKLRTHIIHILQQRDILTYRETFARFKNTIYTWLCSLLININRLSGPTFSTLFLCSKSRKGKHKRWTGLSSKIRTCGLLNPNQALCQTELYPDINMVEKVRIELTTSGLSDLRSNHLSYFSIFSRHFISYYKN